MKTELTALVVIAVASFVGRAHAAGISGQGDWETTLQPRDLDGNAANGPEAFYDTTLDITWLRNANVNPGAVIDWNAANTLVNALVVNGVGGWRLPTMVDTAAPGCDLSFAGGTDCGYNVQTASSEMAHLFYVTLGNKAYCDPTASTVSTCVVQAGWRMTNTGGFQDFDAFSEYWSGLEYAPSTREAWASNPGRVSRTTTSRAFRGVSWRCTPAT